MRKVIPGVDSVAIARGKNRAVVAVVLPSTSSMGDSFRSRVFKINFDS